MSADTTGNAQLERIIEYLENYPGMQQVNAGSPIDMIDGNTLVNVILIYPTETTPLDLNIHVRDTIKVEAHHGGVKE